MNRTALLLAAAFAATASLPAAAELRKYKDWPSSPEAYFLSADEKKTWESVKTDEDAEKFVQTYRSARGQGFAAAIQSRIDFADRTLAIGKVRGAATLRGKTLILLGAPTRVSASQFGSGVDTSKVDLATIDGRAGSGGANSPGSSNTSPLTNSGGPADALRTAHTPDQKTVQAWVYGAGALPVGDKTHETSLVFTIDQNLFKESVAEPAKLDELFQKVVEYWAPKKQ
jgi:GWxTD domain-containing protein